jgi:hypothetical protein
MWVARSDDGGTWAGQQKFAGTDVTDTTGLFDSPVEVSLPADRLAVRGGDRRRDHQSNVPQLARGHPAAPDLGHFSALSDSARR